MKGQRAVRADERRWWGALLLVTIVALPASAGANTASQILYAKGLVPFNQQRWDEAYQLFNAAVTADPNDALALYYRGVSSARLGFPDKARVDIERAIGLSPDLPGAALDLGILAFDAQQYDQAETWLQRASQDPRDHFMAAFYLGLSRFRQGDDAAAHQFFAEAAKDPGLRGSAEYYAALALLRQGQTEQARQLLTSVRDGQPNTELGRAAAEYLAAPAVAPAAPARAKAWSVYGDLGLEYDSNVVLASSEEAIKQSRGITRQADGRVVLVAGADYQLDVLDVATARLSYTFSQSLHFHLSDFDLTDNRLRLDIVSRPDWYQLGISGWYDYYLIDFQTYYQQGVVLPWVTFFEGDVSATQIYYQFTGQNFIFMPFHPYLDGFDNAVGVLQHFLLGAEDRVLTLGYQFDDEDPISQNGNNFAYTGNQVSIFLTSDLWGWAQGTAGYQFRYESYKSPNTRNASGFHRRDQQSTFLVDLRRAITPYLAVHFWYIPVINASNTDEFRYDRNVVHIGVEARY